MEIREFYHLKRRNLGITMQEIANYLSVNQSTISRYETGKIKMWRLVNEYVEYIENKEKQN